MSGAPTALQTKLAAQILSHARLSGWAAGHHVTEESLLPVLGTSRSPIRKAMARLADEGVLEKRPNRGFFLRTLPAAEAEPASEPGPDRVYTAIAMDRVAGALPDQVSENELMRRYGVSRALLHQVLARVAAEGWIERRPGRGWGFQPLIDTVEAYRENYRFRQMLEPAALRSPDFVIDPARVAALQAQQRQVRDSGHRTLGQIELYEINARFHEGLAAMANNRFVVQTLQRLNQLRRLVEYGRPLDRGRARRVCEEHLFILEALASGDRETAALRLERHLAGALDEKTRSDPLDRVSPCPS